MLNQSRFFLFITCQCVRKYVWRVLKPRWYLIMITTFVLARKIGKFISRKYIGRWLNICDILEKKKLTVNFAWICRDLKMYLLKVTLLWWCWERIHTFMQWRISKTLTFQIFSQSKAGHYPRKRKKCISKD